jgi:hypothetical protein
MTPAERLRWLESTLAEARQLLGRARDAQVRPKKVTAAATEQH